jgi:hypothetical protein
MEINRLKMRFDVRKRKLFLGQFVLLKKLFSAVNLLSPDSIQEEEYKWLHKEYLRSVGYVERIVPGLTTTDNLKCIYESAVPVSKSLSHY